MAKIKKHIQLNVLLWALFAMFFLSGVAWCGSIICQNIYESVKPTLAEHFNNR